MKFLPGLSSRHEYSHLASRSPDSNPVDSDTPKARVRGIPIVTTAIIALVTSACAALIGLWCGRHVVALDRLCTRHVAGYSPVLDHIDIKYNEVQFDGRFAKENVYRGLPSSSAVDDAWKALGGGYRPFLITDSEAARAGLTKNHSRRNTKYGGGYPVFFEGLHHLHCLDLVRQSLYYNYDHYLERGAGPFSDPPEVLHWHVSHCLDILRQRLMCTMDIGVFGSVWVGNRTDPHPFVDFNTKHMCKNFDEIRAWAQQNQIESPLPADYWEPLDDDAYIWEKAP